MNALKKGILDLLKACIKEEKIQLPADFDWGQACRVGKEHQILSMLYYGALNAELALPEAVQTKLESVTFQCIFIDQNQLYEIGQLREKFRENGIEFVLLKGTLLKHLYPRTEVRLMSDADVLIKTEQYDRIRPIMKEMGYTEVLESDHELVWDKPGALHLELHKRLIPSYNKDYYAYFGDGWRLARKTETSEYVMGNEDQFIYLFTHYAKHYRDGGIGIRHLVDLYVFLRAYPDLDMAYVERELESLQLLTFCKNSLETVRFWFGEGEETPMAAFMTDKIFGSGAYGTEKDHVLSEGVKTAKEADRESVRRRKLWGLIFPSAKALSQKYPVLKKAPILLPLVWVYRWIVTLLFRRRTIRHQRERVELLTAENLSGYQDELNYVGLDFNFQE